MLILLLRLKNSSITVAFMVSLMLSVSKYIFMIQLFVLASTVNFIASGLVHILLYVFMVRHHTRYCWRELNVLFTSIA